MFEPNPWGFLSILTVVVSSLFAFFLLANSGSDPDCEADLMIHGARIIIFVVIFVYSLIGTRIAKTELAKKKPGRSCARSEFAIWPGLQCILRPLPASS